LVEAGH